MHISVSTYIVVSFMVHSKTKLSKLICTQSFLLSLGGRPVSAETLLIHVVGQMVFCCTVPLHAFTGLPSDGHMDLFPIFHSYKPCYRECVGVCFTLLLCGNTFQCSVERALGLKYKCICSFERWWHFSPLIFPPSF